MGMTPEEYQKKFAPSEETEQIHLMMWCKWKAAQYPELETIYHVPNEGKRSAVTGSRLKEMGLRPGVPDICLPVPKAGFCALYIEMKKHGGKPTDNQIYWLNMLDRYCNCVAICEGAEAAEELITAYLKQDHEKLDKLRLSAERGDFDRFKAPEPKPKKKKAKRREHSEKKHDLCANIIGGAAILQLTAIIADIAIHGTVTEAILVPAAIASALGLAGEIERRRIDTYECRYDNCSQSDKY